MWGVGSGGALPPALAARRPRPASGPGVPPARARGPAASACLAVALSPVQGVQGRRRPSGQRGRGKDSTEGGQTLHPAQVGALGRGPRPLHLAATPPHFTLASCPQYDRQ